MIATRYMTADKSARIVAHTFAAQLNPGEELTDETIGSPTFAHRDSPGETWSPPKVVAPFLRYRLWVEWCDSQGFTHEERS